MDLGSNVDCRPTQLLNFAAMGAVFAHKFLGTENPRVALLSVGSEKSKGNRQVQESYQLLERSHLNFVGNVEGMDFFTDKADVIVCDGFVGNILIKFTEGMGAALGRLPVPATGSVYVGGADERCVQRPVADHQPAAYYGGPPVRGQRRGGGRTRVIQGRGRGRRD